MASKASRDRKPKHAAFAVAAPGLEAITAAELHELGIKRTTVTKGGVSFGATTRELYVANLWLRTASRVVVRAARFPAATFDELIDGVRSVDWSRWLAAGDPVQLRVTSHSSRLYHTGAIAERVLDALDATAAPGAGDRDDAQLVMVRLTRNEVTISVDSSGAQLHRRGYRLEGAKAPLRETIAAAMVLSSGWTPGALLVDPMCGSGTIAIEAAMVARRIPPGQLREFAFGTWPSFEPGTWASVMAGAESAMDAAATGPLSIVAADRDAGAAAATAANAERAGVLADLDVRTAAISDLSVDRDLVGETTGALVTNPPWGDRVGGKDLRDLYARLGQVARRELAGGRLGVLTADARLASHIGIPLEGVFDVDAGGTPVRFSAGPIPVG